MKRLNFGWPLRLTAALVGVMTLTAKSQETNLTPATPSRSLDALVAEALERNPELKFYEAELAAARAGRKTAGSLANPQVSGSIGEKTVRGGGVSAEGVAWSVSVVQPFEWPGRIGLLNQLRGVAPKEPLRVTPAELAFRPRAEAETLLALARTNNFELRLRAVELAQQGFRVDLARNERFLALSVGPAISEENVGGTRERIVGVGVSLPLSLWNRNGGNIDAAKARQMQAEVSLAVAQREVERKVLEAALTYETKLRAMAKWRPDSVQHFKEAAEVADRHYRLGAVPISTYVELQKQYLEAVESLLDTKRAALEAAAQLELLTGKDAP